MPPNHRVASFLSLALLCFATAAFGATHQVQVISFRFEPENLTIAPGDTVVWRNTGGIHNVMADDSSFRSGDPDSAAWTFTRVFDTAGLFGYHCQPHGGPGGLGMSGSINVIQSTPAFAISIGIGGTWNSPGIPSQGFLLEVNPPLNSLVLGWFTWSATTPGSYDWLSAIGPISGDSATVDLQRSSGGLFNSTTPTTSTSVGSATFRFTDCCTGTVTYQRNDSGQSGTVPIRRLTPVPPTSGEPEPANR
jgi:plastocyanin